MNIDIKGARWAQSVGNPLDLNSSIVVRPRPSSRAGSYVARHFRVDPALADLIADLAGLGEART